MTDDLPTPGHPLRLPARSQSIAFKPHCHASFHLGFGRPHFLFPGISILNPFLIICSSNLSITCPYQINLLSVIFWKPAPLSLFLGCVRSCSCLCVSLHRVHTSIIAFSVITPLLGSIMLQLMTNCDRELLIV